MSTKNMPKDITPGTDPEPQTQGEAVTPEYIPAPNDLCVTANTLTFNWREEEITAWVDRIAESYSAIVVTEDAIPGIKAEMANLNGIIKQLNADRIAAAKSVSAPIKAFEDKVKALCAKIDSARENMASQVKAFEDAAREEKRQEVLFAIETLTAEAGFPGLEIPVQDSWLNKSQKPKQTAADIQAFILRHVQAEQAAAAAEQAKQDRAVAIESQNAALAQGHGFTLPASNFYRLNNLEIPLVEVNAAMTEAYRIGAEANARANVAPVPPTNATQAPLDVFGRRPMVDPLPLVRASDVPTVREGLTLHVEYDTANILDVREALAQLEACCLNFIWHKKPLADATSQAPARSRSRDY